MVKVATGKIDITPTTPQYVCGHAMRHGKSTGVHDPLELTVLWIDVDGTKTCFMNADLIGFGLDFLDRIRTAISEKYDVNKDLIVFSVTHTHSGPNFFGAEFSSMAGEPEYIAYVEERVLTCVEKAQEHFTEVSKVTMRKGEVFGYYSNRNSLDKVGDQWIYVLEFKDAEDKNIAAFVNMSCHSTVNSPTELNLSADLLGNVRRELVKYLGVEPCMANGNAGNISNRQLRRGNDWNELKRVTSGIADEIAKFGEGVELQLAAPQVKTLEFRVDYVTDKEPLIAKLAAMEAKLKEYEAMEETPELFDEKKWMYSEVSGYKRKIATDEVHVNLDSSVIRMGDLEIVVVPCELAAGLGLTIKGASNAKECILWGYANGQGGYVVEASEFDGGHDGLSTQLKKGQAEEYMGKVIQTLF